MTDLSQTLDQETSHEEMSIPMPEEGVGAPQAARSAEQAARKQQRRVDSRNWYPRENVAVLMTPFQVGSPYISKLWNATFARTQIAMHMLLEVVPSQGEMEQARGVEKTLDERMTTIESEIDNEIKRLKAIATAEGIVDIPSMSYPNIQAVELPVFTPGAGRFLRLLGKVDHLFWMTDYLWIQGVLKIDHKWQIINTYKRQIWEFVKFTTMTWVRARSSLRRKQEQQAARRNGETRKPLIAEAGSESQVETAQAA